MTLVDVFASWRADRRIKKLIRNANHAKLTEVQENTFTRVTGVVQPHAARVLEAPLSGRLCAYYAIQVRDSVGRRGLDGRPQFSNQSIFDEQEGVVFELEADGTRVVIDPTGAAWISSGFDHDVELGDARARAFAKRVGLIGSLNRPRFCEAILGLGEKIAVFGAAVAEPDVTAQHGERGFRDSAPLRLRFVGSDTFPLMIRDDVGSL